MSRPFASGLFNAICCIAPLLWPLYHVYALHDAWPRLTVLTDLWSVFFGGACIGTIAGGFIARAAHRRADAMYKAQADALYAARTTEIFGRRDALTARLTRGSDA